ncbi:MAG: nickel-dependent lactate racemase [Desulfobacterales bacterium]|nr:MAG: nickel-dependent lactate racemase [Desulfobacterales bacterium]
MIGNSIALLYGHAQYRVSLPGDCVIHAIHKHTEKPLADPARAARTALRAPVGLPPLSQWARHGGKACILVADITRPTPNGALLPQVVAELEAAGISRTEMTILIATGLHRPAPEAEKKIIVGDSHVFNTVRVENHYANDDRQHVKIGTTSSGTPVWVDRRFVEADVKVVIGLVEPHFMAGYSGGRKLVVPGLAHRETILVFHSPKFMEHPRACNCVIDGNPLHQDHLEIMAMVGAVFSLNVIIDENREMVFINSGEIIQSHLESVAFARGICEVPVPRQFDTILTSAGGFPLDKTYYQTVKGMVSPLDILRPGGRVIIVSECSEGMGSADFLESQKLLAELGPEGFIQRISAPAYRPIVDQWQTEKLVEALRKGQIYLYTANLNAQDWALTCVSRAENPRQAVLESIERSGDPHVAVIPEGPYVIPLLRQ